MPFNREVSLVGARGKDGSVEVYPLAENVHTNGVLSLSTAIDAPELQAQAKQMFTAVVDSWITLAYWHSSSLMSMAHC